MAIDWGRTPTNEVKPMGPLGIPELVILLVVFLPIVAGVALAIPARRRAKRFGYDSLSAYLRAVPRTDEERRDAADLALKGVVLCILGVIFAPLVLIGLMPLFYGGRKLAYASLGLGLVDDSDPS
jgi:hypothetical protein